MKEKSLKRSCSDVAFWRLSRKFFLLAMDVFLGAGGGGGRRDVIEGALMPLDDDEVRWEEEAAFKDSLKGDNVLLALLIRLCTELVMVIPSLIMIP